MLAGLFDQIVLYNWVKEHWQDIIMIYGGIVIIASIIVKWTPTLADDAFLLKIIKFMSKYLALNRTIKDSEIRKELEKRLNK